MSGAYPWTPEEHAVIEAKRGRPVTDDGVKPRKIDDPADVANLSIVDRVLADARRASQ